jgi:hypothetical protein
MPKRKAPPASRPPIATDPSPDSRQDSRRWRWWPVRIAGAWIALGGVLKTVSGLPSDLPVPILSLDLDPLMILTVAATVELLVGTVAMIAPRRGWMPAAALLGLFIVILAGHWWQGGGSCGCFGTALALPAWVMLAADATLLAGVVFAVRRGTGRSTPEPKRLLDTPTRLALGLGILLAVAAAILTDRRLASLRPVEAVAAAPVPNLSGVTEPKAWSLPSSVPEQVLLRPSQWVGLPLSETEFGRWVDVSSFPREGRMILYYESCNHCADHLRELADAQEAAPGDATNYILAQMPTPQGYTGRLHVNRVPKAAAHVVLPDVVKAYVITPPWDVFLEGGRVVRAERVKREGEKG